MQRRLARNLAIGAGLAVIATLAGDYVVWRVLTGRLLDGFVAWQTQLTSHGWQAQAQRMDAAGWPFEASVRLGGARLGQVGPGGFTWSAERVRFGVSVLHPRTLFVEPDGLQSVDGPGITPVRFRAARLAAHAPLGGRVEQAEASAAELAIAAPLGEVMITTARLDAHWAADAARMSVSAGPVSLPAGQRWGLGRTIASLSLSVVAHGAWPPGPARVAAARWRDGGGRLDVDRAALRWGALDAALHGLVALDRALQPEASLELSVVAPGAALSMLADTGVISRGASTAAQAVLALLALPGQFGGHEAPLDLPVRVQDGGIYLGQIPLASVPALRWGGE